MHFIEQSKIFGHQFIHLSFYLGDIYHNHAHYDDIHKHNKVVEQFLNNIRGPPIAFNKRLWAEINENVAEGDNYYIGSQLARKECILHYKNGNPDLTLQLLINRSKTCHYHNDALIVQYPDSTIAFGPNQDIQKDTHNNSHYHSCLHSLLGWVNKFKVEIILTLIVLIESFVNFLHLGNSKKSVHHSIYGYD